jgi:hypothetical protein
LSLLNNQTELPIYFEPEVDGRCHLPKYPNLGLGAITVFCHLSNVYAAAGHCCYLVREAGSGMMMALDATDS